MRVTNTSSRRLAKHTHAMPARTDRSAFMHSSLPCGGGFVPRSDSSPRPTRISHSRVALHVQKREVPASVPGRAGQVARALLFFLGDRALLTHTAVTHATVRAPLSPRQVRKETRACDRENPSPHSSQFRWLSSEPPPPRCRRPRNRRG